MKGCQIHKNSVLIEILDENQYKVFLEERTEEDRRLSQSYSGHEDTRYGHTEII